MVLPVTTDPSFATILTAVHAELTKGENARVIKTEAATIFVSIVCFTIIFLDRLIGRQWICPRMTRLRVAVHSFIALHGISSIEDISRRCKDVFDCNAQAKFSTRSLLLPGQSYRPVERSIA
jgi:hypothetical protein